MSDTKFTKGNWHQSHRKGADGMYNTEVYDQEGSTICQLAWYAIKEPNGVTRTNREDNANLIKTAPKMYEMLESLREDYGIGSAVGKDIDALLAEARGEL